MEARILNTSHVAVGIVDQFESFIWVEKYREPGGFEIYTPFSENLYSMLQPDYYLTIPQSTRAMIIEDIQIKSDPENGPRLKVTGRSLESILDRRIVLRKTIVDTNVQSAFLTLLTENAINSVYPERNIPDFQFSQSSNPAVTLVNIKAQFYSETLLEVANILAEQYDVGYAIEFTPDFKMNFSFKIGANRSYSQSINPYVVFSPIFDNVVSSDYYYTKRSKKTYALITGQAPSGSPGFSYRGQAWENGVNTSGLTRREMHVDANDMTLYPESSSTPIPEADYLNQLAQRGNEELAKNIEWSTFDAQIDISNTYTYGIDFYLGDILQIEDQYGHNGSVQVMEMTFCQNLEGYSVYPTLRSV